LVEKQSNAIKNLTSKALSVNEIRESEFEHIFSWDNKVGQKERRNAGFRVW